MYASYEKLVLATSKTEIFTGLNYCNFVLGSVCKREPFEHIELRQKGFWEYLLWMDPYNFGGITVEHWEQGPDLGGDLGGDVDAGAGAGVVVGGTKAADQRARLLAQVETSVDMEWNVAEYLPDLAHEKFLRVIAEYVYEVGVVWRGGVG